jgi:hypothetical protein
MPALHPSLLLPEDFIPEFSLHLAILHQTGAKNPGAVYKYRTAGSSDKMITIKKQHDSRVFMIHPEGPDSNRKNDS